MNRWRLYALGGAMTYCIRLGVAAALIELADAAFAASYAIATGLVVAFSFWYNRTITFETSGEPFRELAAYLLTLILFNALDFLLTVLLTTVANISYPAAITMVTVALFVAKFPVFRSIVFKPQG